MNDSDLGFIFVSLVATRCRQSKQQLQVKESLQQSLGPRPFLHVRPLALIHLICALTLPVHSLFLNIDLSHTGARTDAATL